MGTREFAVNNPAPFEGRSAFGNSNSSEVPVPKGLPLPNTSIKICGCLKHITIYKHSGLNRTWSTEKKRMVSVVVVAAVAAAVDLPGSLRVGQMESQDHSQKHSVPSYSTTR